MRGSCGVLRSLVTQSLSGRQMSDLPFQSARLGSFFQEPPTIRNPWLSDEVLQSYLRRTITDKSIYERCVKDLERFGERIPKEIEELHRKCDQDLPRVEHFDAWGKRVDKLLTCDAWKRMKDISAEESFISIGYDKSYKEFNRIVEYAKLYLYSPSAGLYTCPLAMTDGAAKVLKELKLCDEYSEIYGRLTSNDPEKFWTSGQWMTEKRGGSDVAQGTETLAFPTKDGMYSLHGYKWFSSATDADVALTLARLTDDNGQPIRGTKGLSLFLLHIRDPDSGLLNNIEILKLKNKLGTRQVPTAELLLTGTLAHKISDSGRGVASIAHMLNITRIHNALSAVGAMRRIVNVGCEYAGKRKAFGKVLTELPLHSATLADMEMETRGSFLFLMEASRLLGLQDAGTSTQKEKHLLRLFTPILKLYTGKEAVWTVSEGLEAFGGQGYIEDTGFPAMLRDAQVLPIWEGTTNILSLDVLRHLSKDGPDILAALQEDVKEKLGKCPLELSSAKEALLDALKILMDFFSAHPELLECAARDFAFTLAEIYIGSLLIHQASYPDASANELLVAKRWSKIKRISHLKERSIYSERTVNENKDLVLSMI